MKNYPKELKRKRENSHEILYLYLIFVFYGAEMSASIRPDHLVDGRRLWGSDQPDPTPSFFKNLSLLHAMQLLPVDVETYGHLV